MALRAVACLDVGQLTMGRTGRLGVMPRHVAETHWPRISASSPSLRPAAVVSEPSIRDVERDPTETTLETRRSSPDNHCLEERHLP